MNKYLFTHDYGTGGVGFYIYADDPKQVTDRYPWLEYVATKPPWLVKEEAERGTFLRCFNLYDDPKELDWFKGIIVSSKIKRE